MRWCRFQAGAKPHWWFSVSKLEGGVPQPAGQLAKPREHFIDVHGMFDGCEGRQWCWSGWSVSGLNGNTLGPWLLRACSYFGNFDFGEFLFRSVAGQGPEFWAKCSFGLSLIFGVSRASPSNYARSIILVPPHCDNPQRDRRQPFPPILLRSRPWVSRVHFYPTMCTFPTLRGRRKRFSIALVVRTREVTLTRDMADVRSVLFSLTQDETSPLESSVAVDAKQNRDSSVVACANLNGERPVVDKKTCVACCC